MKVLVANRGEIAVRVIRALREMGLKSVAVYSEEDAHCPHARLADEAWCIGPGPARESYLNIARVLAAARVSGAKAVHPGYGFLSENDAFAGACEEAGMLFIGPKPAVMRDLADKFKTKEIVRQAGVPVIPGSRIFLKDAKTALDSAREIGFPVLLKASFGGGGRGIYAVRDEKLFMATYDVARAESKAAVGKEELYLEKLQEDVRHIEVQAAADLHGHVASFTERDCTIQRRNQKLIEETPSPFINEEVRPKLLDAASKAIAASGITTVATVEFLLLPDLKTFYFMEINKRIQVEHSVTEELLGIDLIQAQVALALGEHLRIKPMVHDGRHSIEARINAEDPSQDFLPSEGTVTRFGAPGGPGIRLDTYIEPYLHFGTSYDSLLAKLIATSPKGRLAAIAKMRGALAEMKIEGFPTTLSLHRKLMEDPVFVSSREWFSTRYLEKWLPKITFN